MSDTSRGRSKSTNSRKPTTTTTTSTTRSSSDKLLVFQDELLKHEHSTNDSDDPSLAFFELANAPMVAYRLSLPPLHDDDESSRQVLVRVKQNSEAQTHTGGVVWETSYLLLGYLLGQQRRQKQQQQQQQPRSVGRIVEVGAGCGMLGISLAVAGQASEVILTEVDLVMPLLQENVDENQSLLVSSRVTMRACRLDWTQFKQDAKKAHLEPHSVDTIVGTDVVFTPKLVEPLWQTLQYLSHARTVIYLCVQIRCAASHEILLENAAAYGFVMEQIMNNSSSNNNKDDDNSDDGDEDGDGAIRSLPSWALEMECFLFRITRVPDTKPKKKKRRKANSPSSMEQKASSL
eukprot:scaffold38028_cov191-Amphora_coffeaeformis.AAC.5